MAKSKKDNLKAMKKAEESKNLENKTTPDVDIETSDADENNTGIIDGYKQLHRNELPFEGKLYPATWSFYYRSPTTKEVANFSTIDEEDKPGIVKAVTSLIAKCFVIIDTENDKEISSKELNDGERLFYFLKLREFYLNDAPIQYNIINDEVEGGVVKVNFFAASLVFPELKSGLLDKFDGRHFTFEYPGCDDDRIRFLIPTLKTSERILNYVQNLHKKVSDRGQDNVKKGDFDKQLLLFAPFLYETGTESMISLSKKFNELQKNDNKYRTLNNIINKINLSNDEAIRYVVDGNEEDCLMKFPGGWKGMFINDGEFNEIF